MMSCSSYFILISKNPVDPLLAYATVKPGNGELTVKMGPIFSPFGIVNSVKKGDPCVIINGTFRNDYDKDYYFSITADVYNSKR